MFNHEELTVFCREQFVPFEKATLSIANTGFLYGLGVFSGIRAHYNNEKKKLYIFRPKDHFKRLYNSCKLFHYKNFLDLYDEKRFIDVLVKLIKVNEIKEDVYIRVTNFSDENKISPKFMQYKDSFSAFLYPLGDYVPTSGMRCKVSSYNRVEDNAIPARAKVNGLYVNTGFTKTEALMLGYDEAIVLDQRGHVVEGSAENIFIVIDGKLITPPVSDNILEGITRRTIITLAKDNNIEVVERNIDRSELYFAEEVFLTGTGAKVSPVVEIDNILISDGKVGKTSKMLQDLYARVVRGEEQKYLSFLVDVYDHKITSDI